METRNKKILVISAGLAGVGKTTHLKALNKAITDGVYLDKDIINLALLQGKDYFSDYYNQYVKSQSYEVMLQLARDNLAQERVVILDGYFGDKLTSPLLRDFLDAPDIDCKVIYFHCSGNKQFERLEKRGDHRDAEKLTEGKFISYRHDHIKKHLVELTQIPHLIIDTEDEKNLQANVELILQFLNLSSVANKIIPVDKNQCTLTPNQAMQGAIEFGALIAKINPCVAQSNLIKELKLDSKCSQESWLWNRKAFITTSVGLASLYVGYSLFARRNAIPTLNNICNFSFKL